MNSFHPYTIFPLGDAALTIDFGNRIDTETNEKVLRLFHAIQQKKIPFFTDLIPAYSSLTVCYEPSMIYDHKTGGQTVFEAVAGMIESFEFTNIPLPYKPRTHEIPVCYALSFAPDIEEVAATSRLSIEEIIQIHTAKTYRVYMLGFLPGFAYMGSLDEKIAMARRVHPRARVEPGSVGIAGRQTGIYPMASPGGWQLIGRTPVSIFDDQFSEPALFSPGDQVRFFSITEHEFAHYQARHT